MACKLQIYAIPLNQKHCERRTVKEGLLKKDCEIRIAKEKLQREIARKKQWETSTGKDRREQANRIYQ